MKGKPSKFKFYLNGLAIFYETIAFTTDLLNRNGSTHDAYTGYTWLRVRACVYTAEISCLTNRKWVCACVGATVSHPVPIGALSRCMCSVRGGLIVKCPTCRSYKMKELHFLYKVLKKIVLWVLALIKTQTLKLF